MCSKNNRLVQADTVSAPPLECRYQENIPDTPSVLDSADKTQRDNGHKRSGPLLECMFRPHKHDIPFQHAHNRRCT